MGEEKTKPEIKPEDFEGYGSEMIDMVKVVKDQAKEINDLKGQVQDVGERVYQSDEADFYSKLAELVPDWQTINRSQGFLDWLAEKDRFVGVSRQALLDDAHQCLDVNHVATFLKTFKAGGSSPRGPELELGSKGSRVTRADVAKAAKDYQTGRLSEEDFNKVANALQRSIQREALI